MSHIPYLRFGSAGDAGVDSSKRAPIELTSANSSNFEPSAPGPGIVSNPIRTSVVVPLAIVANNIAASQIMNGAVTLTAGTSATATTLYGNSVIDITGSPDFDRAIIITGAASGTAVAFTITGYDMYNQYQSEVITGPTTGTVTSTKTYRYIRSITTAATTTSAFTIGTSDVFGFPVRVTNFDQVLIFWNNALITATTGFTAADTTSPATTATGAVRGKYAVQSASDGTKRLAIWANLLPSTVNSMNTAYGVVPA